MIEEANFAFWVNKQYTDFMHIFPLWHKNHDEAELISDESVRFYLPNDSKRQRQVVAYLQGTRPRKEAFTHEELPRVNPSQHAKSLLDELFFQVRPRGQSGKFNYEPSDALIEALRPEYQERLDQTFRHPESIQLNGYSLHEFKAFYVALLVLCAIHEYICYPWNVSGHPIPISSLVMVRSRSSWITRISKISHVPKDICTKILADLTLDPSNKNGSLCIYPFVSVDNSILAVAPQFPLISAVDENILRAFSYRFPALFSAENTEKDMAMKTTLYAANPSYHLEDSVQLPDKSTEIDIIIEDDSSSTVVLADLKWIRKPNRILERIDREKEVEKGRAQVASSARLCQTRP